MGTSASTSLSVSPSFASSPVSTTETTPSISETKSPFRTLNGNLDPTVVEVVNKALQETKTSATDGYRWRKYGQKTVKGSKHPRNYFKCTFPGCLVKKYVEKYEEEGKTEDRVTYKGQHTHDPSKITRVSAQDQLTFKNSVLSEGLGPNGELKISDPIPSPLPLPPIVVETPEKQPSPEPIGSFCTTPRLVVETSAEVDALDDGYNWRKYGQKNVKGSPNPRSYYKCTEETCPVKKQVERHGNSIINTYEGTHNHIVPGVDECMGKKKKRKVSRTIEGGHCDLNKRKKQKSFSNDSFLTNETSTNKEFTSDVASSEDVISLMLPNPPEPNELSNRSVIPLQDIHDGDIVDSTKMEKS